MKNKKNQKQEEQNNGEQINNRNDGFDELKELLQRTQANFENYKKQSEKRILEIQKMAAKEVILQVLPVLDNFDLALKNTEHSKHEDFIQGIELIYSQLNSMLQSNGVKEIKTNHQKFDPYLHEALMKVESDQEQDIIIEEFQKGFTLNSEVIRHAKVKISSGKKEVKNENSEKTNENNTEE
jgi:molecular chaperone GrpE